MKKQGVGRCGRHAVALLAWVAGWGISAGTLQAELHYSTGFSAPPFTAGPNTWAGTDGWESTDLTSESQGILGDGANQAAYLGHYAPTYDYTEVNRNFHYDPVAEGTPVVTFDMQIALMGSTNGYEDFFYVNILNDEQTWIAGLWFSNVTKEVYRFDGQSFNHTWVSFANGEDLRLTFAIDFAANTWGVTLDGTEVISGTEFNGSSAERSLGALSFAWAVQESGSPGDNYIVVDNLSVETAPAPEPGTCLLLSTGLACLLLKRRPSIAP